MAEKKATKKNKELEVSEDTTSEKNTEATTVEQTVAEKPVKKVTKKTVKNVEPEETEAVVEDVDKPLAKAGKRSVKAVKEVEQKIAKEERKAKGDTTPQGEAEAKAKQKQNPTRTRLQRRGKNYRKVAELIEKGKVYSLKEGLDLAIKTSVGKFDSTVEIHLNLNVDPKLADQNLRGTVSLPHGTGKTVRVAAFVAAEQVEAAKKAGADVAGEDDFLAALDKEQMDFDVLISTPQLMGRLGKYARLLGPRGLMPNPKSGTVTANVNQAIKEAKGGKVEYRVDKQSIMHQGIGKVSFGGDKLYDNVKMFIDNLNANKPASVKGVLIKNMTVTTTMGPGIKVEAGSL